MLGLLARALDPNAAVQLSPSSRNATYAAFISLNIIGTVLLLVLLLTFMTRRASAHPTLINLCVGWIIGATLCCLGFYSLSPSGIFCNIQAALIWAAPPMNAASALALTIYVWRFVRDSMGNTTAAKWTRMHTIFAILAPYIVFIAFGIAGAVVVVNQPTAVSLDRRVLYCSLPPGPYSTVTSITTGLELIATLGFTGGIVHALWPLIRVEGLVPRMTKPANFDLQFIARVLAFSIVVFICVLLSIAAVFRTSIIPDMATATLPVIVALMFGSQPRVLRAWSCSRRIEQPTKEKHVDLADV